MTGEKPLEEYTVKQLKEMARKIEGIEGLSIMKKDELIAAIKTAKGAPAKETKEKPRKEKQDQSVQTTTTIKEKIKFLKEKREESLKLKDKVGAGRLKRRISRLKKKTRKMV